MNTTLEIGNKDSSSIKFKRDVLSINIDDSLTDVEKMEAIDLLLNPVSTISDYAITFNSEEITFQDTTLEFRGI